MTSVVDALNDFTPKQYGENGHLEYTWSNNDQEKIVQLFFQLNRCEEAERKQLATHFKDIIKASMLRNEHHHVLMLIKLILQTRDIVAGKGEYALAFELIHVIDQLTYHNICKKIIYYLVKELPVKNSVHPYGSWRDIKYLWFNYAWSPEVTNYMIYLLNNQIREDYELLQQGKKYSLAGKWAPREKSKYGDLFKILAENYYPDYIETAMNAKPYTANRVSLARRKCYKEYRKVLSELNKGLDTTQIKQCAGEYSEINYDTVTSVTMHKQRKAFQNQNKDGSLRSKSEDRVRASELFNEWLMNKVNSGETVKGKRVGIVDLVKGALDQHYHKEELGYTTNSADKTILNSQWMDNGKDNESLKNFIPMCDISGSMYSDDAIYASIGLSLRVAEKSTIAKGRVLTFASNPKWVQTSCEDNTFVDNVHTLMNSAPGYSTNFTLALKLILDACVEKNLTSEEVSNLVLVIFSDMQINESGNEAVNATMWNRIKKMYASYGYNKVPHLLFWNLRKTNGFPCLSTDAGASMFSGYSAALLNHFCDKGIEFLQDVTPWKMLLDVLNHERYVHFGFWPQPS